MGVAGFRVRSSWPPHERQEPRLSGLSRGRMLSRSFGSSGWLLLRNRHAWCTTRHRAPQCGNPAHSLRLVAPPSLLRASLGFGPGSAPPIGARARYPRYTLARRSTNLVWAFRADGRAVVVFRAKSGSVTSSTEQRPARSGPYVSLFGWGHGEYWAGGDVQQALGHAAQQQAGQRRVAAGAYDDHHATAPACPSTSGADASPRRLRRLARFAALSWRSQACGWCW
jgi:hypothetical protein